MALITLTTDYGTRDYYAAAVKGALYSAYPEAQIVDISHEIAPFDLHQAAFVLKQAYVHFPPGTIHLIGVGAEWSPDQDQVVVAMDGHYFLGADNGLFALLFPDRKPECIVSIDISQAGDHPTFPLKDMYVRVAAHLARGGKPQVVGREKAHWKESSMFQPMVAENKSHIRGMVVYIDSFGNLITNISKELFEKISGNRKYEIILPRLQRIPEIVENYHESDGDGLVLGLFNASNLLEIALKKGHHGQYGGAASLLGIDYRDTVTIEFK